MKILRNSNNVDQNSALSAFLKSICPEAAPIEKTPIIAEADVSPPEEEDRSIGQLSDKTIARASRHGYHMGSTGWAGGDMDVMLSRLGRK